MLQRILYGFHFLCCRMLPRLFQFLYRIRGIIHWQTQLPLHLCDICGMYFETVFSFYVLLNHLVGNSLFRLVATALLGILSSGTFPSPSPNSTFTLICPSGFLWESSTTVSTCVVTNIGTHILYLVYDMGTHFFRFFYCF